MLRALKAVALPIIVAGFVAVALQKWMLALDAAVGSAARRELEDEAGGAAATAVLFLLAAWLWAGRGSLQRLARALMHRLRPSFQHRPSWGPVFNVETQRAVGKRISTWPVPTSLPRWLDGGLSAALPWASWLVAAVAVAMRVPYFTRARAEFDETVSWIYLQMMGDGVPFWDVVAGGVDAPLFVAVNVAASYVFGPFIPVLRIPAVLFGVGAVLLFHRLVRELHNEKVALLAGLLAAMSPFLTYYSKEARPYSQALFFAMLFTWAFFRSETWRRPYVRSIVLGGLGALTVASHYYTLVYLAAFYAIELGSHWRRGDIKNARRTLVTGLVALAFVAPLISRLLRSLEELPIPYWVHAGVRLDRVLVDQLVFLGTTSSSGALFELVDIAITTVLVLPLAGWVMRILPWPRAHPILMLPWILAPMLAWAAGIISGSNQLFFPRGFICSAPFVLTYGVIVIERAPSVAWRKLFVTGALLIGVLFLASSIMVAVSSDSHSRYGERNVMPVMVQQARAVQGEFDLIVTHHWYVSAYFSYFWLNRDEVYPLGYYNREVAAERGELAAILESLEDIPDDRRVLFLRNSVASSYVDPEGVVERTFAKRREKLREVSCHPEWEPGMALLCEAMTIYGPAR